MRSTIHDGQDRIARFEGERNRPGGPAAGREKPPGAAEVCRRHDGLPSAHGCGAPGLAACGIGGDLPGLVIHGRIEAA